MSLKKNQMYLIAKELLPKFPGYYIHDKEFIIRNSAIAIQGIYFERSSFDDAFAVNIFVDIMSILDSSISLNGFRLEKLRRVDKWYDWSDDIPSITQEIEKDIRAQAPELFAPFNDKKAYKFLTNRSIVRSGWGYDLSRGHLLIMQGKFLRARVTIWQGLSILNEYAKSHPEIVAKITSNNKELLSLPNSKKPAKLLEFAEKFKIEQKMIDLRKGEKARKKELKNSYKETAVDDELSEGKEEE